mmetsp:Transcript_39925/g.77621  ORF Transcript_39925/g.77621 Transcript_39925/m.77621 type:complete len:200 (-) Transcript_39925:1593-2192(-)
MLAPFVAHVSHHVSVSPGAGEGPALPQQEAVPPTLLQRERPIQLNLGVVVVVVCVDAACAVVRLRDDPKLLAVAVGAERREVREPLGQALERRAPGRIVFAHLLAVHLEGQCAAVAVERRLDSPAHVRSEGRVAVGRLVLSVMDVLVVLRLDEVEPSLLVDVETPPYAVLSETAREARMIQGDTYAGITVLVLRPLDRP